MTALTQNRPDEAFILSEANGYRSRAKITLKQDAAAYESGELVIAEYEESEAESGEFDTATGVYVRATSALIAAYDTKQFAFVCRRTPAADANTEASGLVGDAEVKSGEIEAGAGVAIASAVAGQGIVVR